MAKADTTATQQYPLPIDSDGKQRYYQPRKLGHQNDVEAMRKLIENHIHTIILGDPGTGKTALVQAAAPNAENEIGHSKMTAPDMLYRPRINEHGDVVMDEAPLVRAVKKGVPFYLDEALRLSDDGWTPLFSAMDGRGFLIGGNLDGTDLPITPGFVVIAASNPFVRNAFFPDAIASRFHILTMETNESTLEKLNLDERLIVIWKNLSKLDGGQTWRPSTRDLVEAQKLIDLGMEDQAAYRLTGMRVPSKDRDAVMSVVGPIMGVRVELMGGVIQ